MCWILRAPLAQGQLTDTKEPAKLARDELRGECSVVTFRRGEVTFGVAAGGACITTGTA